ncbi:MAG: serine/threonine protein kinase [Planctomycetales bacterium]|nr:serine/threonine protein kinase [Planctomycetales bacterium]
MTPDRYARVKELFGRVVDLDDDQRARLLDVQCANDPELRAAVESLVRHDDPRTLIQPRDNSHPSEAGNAEQAVMSDTEVSDASRDSGQPPLSRTNQPDFTPGDLAITKPRRFVWGLDTISQYKRKFGPQGLLALGGLLCGLLLALLGYVGQSSIRKFQKEIRRESLNEIVDGKVVALRLWLNHEQEKAESWSRSYTLRQLIIQLVAQAEQHDDLSVGFAEEPIHGQILKEVEALAGEPEHITIWDRRHRLITDSISGGNRIGLAASPWGASVLASVFEGNSKVFSFDKNRSITKIDPSSSVTPYLAIVTPIRNEQGVIVAAMQVHDTDSSDKESQIMRTFRLGAAGETFLFNQDARMLTSAQFTEQLEKAGLIQPSSDPDTLPEIYLRDPGGNLADGFQVSTPYESLPLTRMARFCISGNDGSDLEGYRDFRGVTVVGAWRWLDDLQIGVATELDADEAEPSIKILRWMAVAVVALIGFCLIVAIASFYSISRIRSNFGENSRLGPYHLEKLIGEGGMGKVFRARHELLKRNTAIKLLKPELIDRDSIARFNREAQSVSQLDNPNTIRVYDYGVSDEHLFYLVMEYIDGITLSKLVQIEQTVRPERAIHLMRQILYSLREAHQSGLVHRDLKPGNVMISRRGGLADVITVLDFGLVKPIDRTAAAQITATNMIAGTPQYLAPERLRDPDTNDPRSDLFSFGAVAFLLLTGRNAIEGPSLAEILHQLVHFVPSPPSDHTDQQIPPKLDQLVLRCLAKDPNQRPQTAQFILDELDQIDQANAWTESAARDWWDHFKTHQASPESNFRID